MKMNFYDTTGLSKKALEALPGILNAMGYQGRYNLTEFGLSINSVKSVVAKAFQKAEEAAFGEEGYLIKLRTTSYSEIWIPKSEAGTLKQAYEKGFEHVENGYPVDRDQEVSVFCTADPSNGTFCPRGDSYRESWQLDYMSGNQDDNDDDERGPRERVYVPETADDDGDMER